jgi:2-dehydropantoate 2-reductase
MRICVVGAGAIGGWMGAHLARLPGVRLSVLARGDTLQALHSQGLRWSDAQGDHVVQVTASDRASALGEQDLVVLAVKAPALQEIVPRLAPMITSATQVMTAMNGVPWWFLQGFGGPWANQPLSSVDPQGRLAQALPAHQIIGCVVHASCAVRSPGHVQHHFGNGLIVGEPSGRNSAATQRVHQSLRDAGFQATLSPCIQQDTWYKLWGNMTMNPVSALTGATADRVLADPLVRAFISSVMLEAKAIGNHLGLQIDQQPEDRHAVTQKLGAFKTSMLQDVEAGRAIELDALVGAVQELGQLTGVATPFTNALLGLSRLHARVRGLYPQADV